MFLFRCCKRIDCGCQSEVDAEVSRSSHSTSDYSQHSEKQIQRRLLPQPVVPSHTKHFSDYSGCSQSTASRALLVGSTQSVDYEEVLCVSVSSKRETDESIYSHVDESVIRKPPCSIGVINNNFSSDPSSSNNNLVQPETNDNKELVQNGGPKNVSGSDESSDVSSAGSSVDDCTSAEVKYVADIRHFRSTHASARPYGDDCCCSTCQSDEGFDRTEDDALVHHSSNLKCSCKSCRDFHSRLQHACASTSFTATTGGVASGNHYRLMTTIAQDGGYTPLTSKSSVVHKIVEPPGFNSDSIQPVGKYASVSADRLGLISGPFESEKGDDDDDGLFSSDDELHYVFHKFIDDGCFKESFADVLPDSGLRPSVAAPSAESGTEVERSLARSADDLEVAFFMLGNISPANQSTSFLSLSFVTPAISASVTDSSEQEAVAAASMEYAADTFGLATESSVSCGYENVSAIQHDSMPCNLGVVCQDAETDTGALNVSGGSPSESVMVSDVLRIAAHGLETSVFVDTNVYMLDDENEQLGSGEVRRDVIVQNLSDTLSFFIELPAAADDEQVSDKDNEYDEDDDASISISPSAHTEVSFTAQELAPAEDDAVVGQRVEIVTPQCITEHPVLIGEVKSSHTADDLSPEYSQQQMAVDVASYICDIVADAVQLISNTDAAASGLCNIASEDLNASHDWSQQILVTNASSYHQPTTKDKYGSESDGLVPSMTGGDMAPQFTTEAYEYSDARADTVGDASVSVRPSDYAVQMTDVQTQEVPQVEDYLISYDAHLLQQPIGEDVDQTPIWSSHSAYSDQTDVELHDLVQPVEHIMSESKQDVELASELSLDSVNRSTGCHHSATQVTHVPTDIVEDFFMQYVLPVDSLGYSTMAAEVAVDKEPRNDVMDQPEVDLGEEELVSAEALENTARNIVDIVVIDAVAESFADAAVLSVMPRAQCDDNAVGLGEVEQGMEGVVEVAELESRAGRMLNDVMSDAVAAVHIGALNSSSSRASSSLVAASSDSQLVIPARKSSCLLHSPPEPLRKKSVHFADMHGLQLETVQHYDQAPEVEDRRSSLEEFLSKLSAAAAERRAKWTEHHTSPVGSWLCSSSVYLLACFELPGSQEELLERVQQCRVALESCSFDDLALAISGVVRVANIAFSKKISVRYSIDYWATSSDIDGEYIPQSNDGPTDRFSFTIILPSVKQFVVGSEVQFAICYVVGDGPSFEFWDNNHGRNYTVRCCSKVTSSDAKIVNISVDSDDDSD